MDTDLRRHLATRSRRNEIPVYTVGPPSTFQLHLEDFFTRFFSSLPAPLLCLPRCLPQDAARDRPLNLLFQVIKRSKTRGDVKMTLRVGPTSLDRVDGERLQHRVSSLPLLSVEKVYLFTDDATQVGKHGGGLLRSPVA